MRTLAEINKQIEHTKSDIAMLAKMGGDITIPLEDLDELYEERSAAEKAKASKHMSTKDCVLSMSDDISEGGNKMKDTTYHVGCGIAGIYAGTVKAKAPDEWDSKTEVTTEAIEAVRDWIVSGCLGGLNSGKNRGGYKWRLKDGRVVALAVEITEADND